MNHCKICIGLHFINVSFASCTSFHDILLLRHATLVLNKKYTLVFLQWFFYETLLGSIQVNISMPGLQQNFCNFWSIHVLVTATAFIIHSINECNGILWWWKCSSHSFIGHCAKAWLLSRSYSSIECYVPLGEWWSYTSCGGQLLLFHISVFCFSSVQMKSNSHCPCNVSFILQVYENQIFKYFENPSELLVNIKDEECIVAYILPKNHQKLRWLVLMHEK